jgi:aryl-alcohol dehydrogenase-like predicted oxidoreductase
MTCAVERPDTLPRRATAVLGRTGLRVGRVGLGLSALGRPEYMALGRDVDLGPDRSVAAMRRRCHAVLDAAYAAGITYLDVARSYGLAEPFVRTWCEARMLPSSAVIVGSKWGYSYKAGWHRHAAVHEVKALTVDTLRAQAAESRALLGPRLHLYQIHSATIESGVLENLPVRAELMRLREQGFRIGVTVTGPRQAAVIRRAVQIAGDGVALFQTIQATWNLLDPSAAGALAEAHAAGCGIIVKEVLANGRLTTRFAAPALEPLRAHAARLDTTVETIAIGAALAQPWADVVLCGAVTCEQVRSAVSACESRPPMPIPSVAESPDEYWRRRQTIAWT